MNSAPQQHHPSSLDPAIERKLTALRSALRRRLLLRGVALVGIAVGVAVVATFFFDYGLYRLTHQHPTAGQRLLAIALALSGVAVVAWRDLLPALRLRLDERSLAHIVERGHPELTDRLLSALHFSRAAARPGHPAGESAAMVQRLIEEAASQTRPLNFQDVVRSAPAMKPAAVLGVIVLVLGMLALANEGLARSWWQRQALLADVSYPTRTRLAFEDDRPLRLVRGSSVEVAVLADSSGVVPAAVTFHLDLPSAGRVTERVERSEGGNPRYVRRFELVSEPFSFFVTGNDARTEVRHIEVVDAPVLSDLRIAVDYPAYMNRPPRTFGADAGRLHLPPGSVLSIEGQATRALSSAVLRLEDEAVGTCRVLEDDSRRVRARLRLDPPRPWPSSMTLAIELTDVEGFSNPRGAAVVVRMVADEPPQVDMAVDAAGGQITSRALVPLELTASDDHGLLALHLDWALGTAAGDVRRRALVQFDPSVRQAGPRRFNFDLLQQEEARFEVGDTLRLQAVATDIYPPPDGPHEALSSPVTLRIVSDEQMLAALVDAQRTMREQFRQVSRTQAGIQQRTQAVAVDAAAGGDELAAATQAIDELIGLQQQVMDLTRTVRDRYQLILTRLRNNRIGAESDIYRLETRVIGPLEELLDGPLGELVEAYDQARRIEDGPLLSARLRRIADAQAEVLARMQEILGEMVKIESAQEVERGLQVIIDMSERIRQITRPTPTPAPGRERLDEDGDEGGGDDDTTREDQP